MGSKVTKTTQLKQNKLTLNINFCSAASPPIFDTLKEKSRTCPNNDTSHGTQTATTSVI